MFKHERLTHASAFPCTGYKSAKEVMPSLQQCQRKLDVITQAAVLTWHCPQVISTHVRRAGIVISVMLGKEDYL